MNSVMILQTASTPLLLTATGGLSMAFRRLPVTLPCEKPRTA